jgi:hypothetical protein
VLLQKTTALEAIPRPANGNTAQLVGFLKPTPAQPPAAVDRFPANSSQSGCFANAALK